MPAYRSPYTVVRVRDDLLFPWHVRQGLDGRLISRHRSQALADKAHMKLVRALVRGTHAERRGVSTSPESMGAMAPPVY